MANVIVIGGGISGLATAYYLRKFASSSVNKILLLESSSRLGGWVNSSRFDDGTVFEHGPRSMRGIGVAGYNTLNMVEDLGMSDEVVAVTKQHPAARKRFIYVNKQLCALPSGIDGIVRKIPPFSSALMFHGWKEPFTKAPKLEDDSVYNFFKRRFTEEVAQYAADPLCRGIFAGDARKLSMRSCFPMMWGWEQNHGSVVRGAMLAPRAKSSETGNLITRFKDEQWAMWSLRSGLQSLPDAIAKYLEEHDVTILKDTQVDHISFPEDGKVKVKYSAAEQETFDHAFVTVPAQTVAQLLPSDQTTLSEHLSGIEAATVGVVNIQYAGDIIPEIAFGHLVPSSEPSKVLGMLYESCVFPEHNGQDNSTRITCMMGGAWFKEMFGDNTDEDQVAAVAVEAVAEQLKVNAEPIKVISQIQKSCIPQYTLGHAGRVSAIETYVAENQLPVSLLGASYRGVSVNECIHNARGAVEEWAATKAGHAAAATAAVA